MGIHIDINTNAEPGEVKAANLPFGVHVLTVDGIKSLYLRGLCYLIDLNCTTSVWTWTEGNMGPTITVHRKSLNVTITEN